MEQQKRPIGRTSYRGMSTGRRQPQTENPGEATGPPPAAQNGSSTNSLAIGAKTVAGIGIGLVAVIGGAAVIGTAVETILIPSLLLKLAGGLAGGGVGMAKGLTDAQKNK